jgi:hypothetical protein
MYLDAPDTADNKALFDALYERRADIERAFGGPLNWYRLDDKKGCWIGVNFEGGWRDESTWPAAIEQAVEAMGRLYATLSPLLRDLRLRR